MWVENECKGLKPSDELKQTRIIRKVSLDVKEEMNQSVVVFSVTEVKYGQHIYMLAVSKTMVVKEYRSGS